MEMVEIEVFIYPISENVDVIDARPEAHDFKNGLNEGEKKWRKEAISNGKAKGKYKRVAHRILSACGLL